MHHRLVFAASVLLSLISTADLGASQTFTTLDPPGSSQAAAYAVSANGTIAGNCGRCGSSGGYEAFVINPAGDYTFYTIPFGPYLAPYFVNNFGSTTGFYYVNQRGRAHEYAKGANGKVWYLDPPRSTNAQAEFAGINNLNQVSGDQEQSDGLSQGFVADLFGQLTLYAVSGASETFGGFINDSGVIAGPYYSLTDDLTHAYIRDQFGNITPFDAPNVGQGTYVSGLNASGQVSGVYADLNYRWHGLMRATDGTLTTFDVPGEGTGEGQGPITAYINDAGQVAGYYYDSNNITHGYLRDQFGNFTEFSDPNAGSGLGQGTYVTGISNTGVIVGYYLDSGGNLHAFKRQ